MNLLAPLLLLSPLWLDPPAGGPAVERPTLAPLVARAQRAVLIIETPAPPLPAGHPSVPSETMTGEGSGVIIHPSGLALTNQHVVECNSTLRARVGTDPAWHTVRVIARDAAADLALLQLDGDSTDWPALPLGDSDALRLGDFVVALGHPFGLTQSVSLGILSGRNRPPSASEHEAVPYNYLQTDAAINPGNSGGPLLDLSGAIIGINTAIHARGQGIGFAIPSAAIKRMLPDLKAHGRFLAGWMGIAIRQAESGVAVGAVKPGGAAEGHLLPDDVITAIDGTPVRTVHALQVATRIAGASQSVLVGVHRGSTAVQVPLVLGAAPPSPDPCDAGSTTPVDHRLPVFRLFDGILELP